jgi:hypothetical protein
MLNLPISVSEGWFVFNATTGTHFGRLFYT